MRRLTLLLAAILACTACMSSRELRHEETDIAIWYIEDTTHGNPRQPGEIQMVDGSAGMAAVARLLTGNVQGDTVIPPRLLESRQRRWPALLGLFRSGLAVVVGTGQDRGLVAPSKGLASADLAMTCELVDAENNDRRILDALVISTAQLEGGRIRQYRETAAAVRIELDQAAGAQLWIGGTGR